jgi:hypothetical protein
MEMLLNYINIGLALQNVETVVEYVARGFVFQTKE